LIRERHKLHVAWDLLVGSNVYRKDDKMFAHQVKSRNAHWQDGGFLQVTENMEEFRKLRGINRILLISKKKKDGQRFKPE
jgi:hypothetical protein